MKSFVIAALAAMIVAPATAATTSNLVTNGSFENVPSNSGDIVNAGNWDVYTSIEGWNSQAGVNGSGIEVQTNPTLRFIDAQDGGRYVELDSHRGTYTNSTMYQDVMLTAGTYRFSFYYSPRTRNVNSNGISYSVGSYVSGLATGPSNGVQRGSWTEFAETFTVAGDETVRLTFSAVGRDDSLGGLVDNVSIAPVPLPAAGWMLLAGVAGLGALRGRRKA